MQFSTFSQLGSDLMTSQKPDSMAGEAVQATSPVGISSLDPLPRLVDLDVLVAMARDVENVFQGIADSDG